MNSNFLITVVGATAVGKTTLSILLANHFNSEILSSDSRQFYKEMNIGTAVPSLEELDQVKHHFIQNQSIFDEYNVGKFERDALQKLKSLFDRQQIAVMVGGSGLYTNAVLNGLDDFPNVPETIRKNLLSILKIKGIDFLKEQLKEVDYTSYKKIDLDNKQRLIRALEISIGTGKPYSSFLNKQKLKRDFTPIIIGISADREILYQRINHRVDLMMQNGLLEEVKSLYKFKHLNALQTVGYKELFQYLDDECTLDFAISEIKKNSRRFAKRQITWNKKNSDIIWFDHEYNIYDIISNINELIAKKQD